MHACVPMPAQCRAIFLRDTDVGTISFAPTGRSCAECGGVLRDTLLDWEDPLPEEELEASEGHMRRADLVLTLGTPPRIEPADPRPKP